MNSIKISDDELFSEFLNSAEDLVKSTQEIRNVFRNVIE